MEEPASPRPNTRNVRGSENPAVKTPKNFTGTRSAASGGGGGSGGAALKAQLDSARYPAGRREQRRRNVTTQVVGTPRKTTAHRKEGPSPSPSPMKSANASPSPLKKAAPIAKKTNRSSTALSSSPLQRVGAVDEATSPSPHRRAESAQRVVASGSSSTLDAKAELLRPLASPERTTPSKLKLRKSLGSRKTTPGKTPANSPAGSSELKGLARKGGQ